MEIPETRYATTVDGVHIAYQVLGEGPIDFVTVNSAWISNVEIIWEWEEMAVALRWLASRGRLIHLDRRGTGLSDAVNGETLPTLEARMDDIAPSWTLSTLPARCWSGWRTAPHNASSSRPRTPNARPG